MIAEGEITLRSLPHEPSHLRGQSAEDPAACQLFLRPTSAPPAGKKPNHVQQIDARAVKGTDWTPTH